MKLIKYAVLSLVVMIFSACGGGGGSSSSNKTNFDVISDNYDFNFSENRRNVGGTIEFRASGFSGGFNWEEIKLKNIEVKVGNCIIKKVETFPSSLTFTNLNSSFMTLNVEFVEKCLEDNLIFLADIETKVIDLNSPKKSTYNKERFAKNCAIDYSPIPKTDDYNLEIIDLYPPLESDSLYKFYYEITDKESKKLIDDNLIDFITIISSDGLMAKLIDGTNEVSKLTKNKAKDFVNIQTFNGEGNVTLEMGVYFKNYNKPLFWSQTTEIFGSSNTKLEVMDFYANLDSNSTYTFSYEVLDRLSNKLLQNDEIDFITITSSDGLVARFSDGVNNVSKLTFNKAKDFVNIKTFDKAGSSTIKIEAHLKNSDKVLSWNNNLNVKIKTIPTSQTETNTTTAPDGSVIVGSKYIKTLENSTLTVGALASEFKSAIYRSGGFIEHSSISSSFSADIVFIKAQGTLKKVEVSSFNNQSLTLNDDINLTDLTDGTKVDVSLFNQCTSKYNEATNILSINDGCSTSSLYVIECNSEKCILSTIK